MASHGLLGVLVPDRLLPFLDADCLFVLWRATLVSPSRSCCCPFTSNVLTGNVDVEAVIEQGDSMLSMTS